MSLGVPENPIDEMGPPIMTFSCRALAWSQGIMSRMWAARRPVGIIENCHGQDAMDITWMSQEVSKRLGSVGYNPNISHL